MEHIINITDKSIYIGESPEKVIGVIDYYINRNGLIVATHTEVNKEYRGQGIALLLFKRLIALAKEKDTKITPHCSYIAEMLNKPKYHDDLYSKY